MSAAQFHFLYCYHLPLDAAVGIICDTQDTIAKGEKRARIPTSRQIGSRSPWESKFYNFGGLKKQVRTVNLMVVIMYQGSVVENS